MKRRWFWLDEYGEGVSPGWAITAIATMLLAFGLLTYWLNDMHMYHYGLFGTKF